MRIGACLSGIIALAVAGCAAQSPYYSGIYAQPYPVAGPSLSRQTDDAVRQMVQSIPVVPQETMVLVTSAADLNANDLQYTTTFGRLLTEQIAGSLVRLGYQVPEVRSAGKLMFRDGGEFILSRDLRDLSRTYPAQLAVATTFTGTGCISYVNLKLIRLDDNVVVGASAFETRRVGEPTRLAFDGRFPPPYISTTVRPC